MKLKLTISNIYFRFFNIMPFLLGLLFATFENDWEKYFIQIGIFLQSWLQIKKGNNDRYIDRIYIALDKCWQNIQFTWLFKRTTGRYILLKLTQLKCFYIFSKAIWWRYCVEMDSGVRIHVGFTNSTWISGLQCFIIKATSVKQCENQMSKHWRR